jgi:hypothetical protein
VSLAAARKPSKEVSIEFSNMEKVFHSRRSVGIKERNPCLLHEIWDGSGKLRTNRDLGPKREI